jgi:lipid-binding SYLF domain-containing protein
LPIPDALLARNSLGNFCPGGRSNHAPDSFKLGGDASVAAGPVGAEAKADLMADIVAFSRSKRIDGGLNLDGTIVSPENSWNEVYYQKKVSPPDIIVRGGVHNQQADALVAAISAAAVRG